MSTPSINQSLHTSTLPFQTPTPFPINHYKYYTLIYTSHHFTCCIQNKICSSHTPLHLYISHSHGSSTVSHLPMGTMCSPFVLKIYTMACTIVVPHACMAIIPSITYAWFPITEIIHHISEKYHPSLVQIISREIHTYHSEIHPDNKGHCSDKVYIPFTSISLTIPYHPSSIIPLHNSSSSPSLL